MGWGVSRRSGCNSPLTSCINLLSQVQSWHTSLSRRATNPSASYIDLHCGASEVRIMCLHFCSPVETFSSCTREKWGSSGSGAILILWGDPFFRIIIVSVSGIMLKFCLLFSVAVSILLYFSSLVIAGLCFKSITRTKSSNFTTLLRLISEGEKAPGREI